MARFEIYPNPIVADRLDFPYVLDIQSDLLYRFAERVCVPLVRTGLIPGVTDRLNPGLEVNGQPVRLHPLGITVFFVNELRGPVGKASAQSLEIETALDMLLRGY
jgi:toxin CcdB